MRDLAETCPPRPPVRWADLRQRVLSAAVLAPVALVCLWLGGWAWSVLVGLGAGGIAVEWARLCGGSPWGARGLGVAGAILLAWAVAALGNAGAGLLVLLAGSTLLAVLARRPLLAIGALYAGLSAVALPWLRAEDASGRANLLFLVMVVWASDVGAYIVGRLVGGAKLWPAVSPGKTWSGAGGGLLCAMLAGLLAGSMLAPGPAWRMLGLAGGLGILAQLGDLLESGVKRRFGVKDSSRLIPGHGGLLDRLDGLLAAAPAAALLALVLGRGAFLWR